MPRALQNFESELVIFVCVWYILYTMSQVDQMLCLFRVSQIVDSFIPKEKASGRSKKSYELATSRFWGVRRVQAQMAQFNLMKKVLKTCNRGRSK